MILVKEIKKNQLMHLSGLHRYLQAPSFVSGLVERGSEKMTLNEYYLEPQINCFY